MGQGCKRSSKKKFIDEIEVDDHYAGLDNSAVDPDSMQYSTLQERDKNENLQDEEYAEVGTNGSVEYENLERQQSEKNSTNDDALYVNATNRIRVDEDVEEAYTTFLPEKKEDEIVYQNTS